MDAVLLFRGLVTLAIAAVMAVMAVMLLTILDGAGNTVLIAEMIIETETENVVLVVDA